MKNAVAVLLFLWFVGSAQGKPLNRYAGSCLSSHQHQEQCSLPLCCLREPKGFSGGMMEYIKATADFLKPIMEAGIYQDISGRVWTPQQQKFISSALSEAVLKTCPNNPTKSELDCRTSLFGFSNEDGLYLKTAHELRCMAHETLNRALFGWSNAFSYVIYSNYQVRNLLSFEGMPLKPTFTQDAYSDRVLSRASTIDLWKMCLKKFSWTCLEFKNFLCHLTSYQVRGYLKSVPGGVFRFDPEINSQECPKFIKALGDKLAADPTTLDFLGDNPVVLDTRRKELSTVAKKLKLNLDLDTLMMTREYEACQVEKARVARLAMPVLQDAWD